MTTRLLFAGITLISLGSLAHANPYAEPPATATDSAPTESATAPAAENELKIQTPESSATAPSFVESLDSSSASAPTPAAAPPAAAATLPPTASTTPERSLLPPGPKPSELMRKLMKAPAGAPLAGLPLTLGEAVRESTSRQDQTERAKAYWELSAATADYYLAVLEAQELQALQAGVVAPGEQWKSRQRDLITRVDVARRSAQAAQLRLHQRLGRRAGATLPLPTDLPHCGRYNPEYDEIFAARPDPVAKQLAELLPLRHAELRTLAQAVADAEAARTLASQQRAPVSDGVELLNAQDLLSLQRRTFVARARDYNQEIAAYTELAAPAEVPTDRLVAMMIRTSAPVDALRWGSTGVELAAAKEELEQADGAASPAGGAQPTFSGEQPVHQVRRRPLQRLLGRDRERSIVVTRLRRLIDRE